MSGRVGRPFPRGVLFAAGGLVGFALVTVAVVRLSGIEITDVPESSVVASVDLRFEDRADGSVAVYGADGDDLIAELAPGSNGFIRGVLRGLARERRQNEVGTQPPFRLVRWADGRLSLQDPTTGRSIELGAFGPTNAGAFALLFESAGADG